VRFSVFRICYFGFCEFCMFGFDVVRIFGCVSFVICDAECLFVLGYLVFA